MAEQHVTLFISRLGEGELEDLTDLISEQVDSVDWVGSINGQPITVRLRLSETDDEDDAEPQDTETAGPTGDDVGSGAPDTTG